MAASNSGTIRVLIADDHGVVRAGLRALLDRQPDMRVVGEVADASEVAALARTTGCGIVLLDLSMPGGGGFAALEQIRNDELETEVLVLTMHDDPALRRRALRSGARGYVCKTAQASHLLQSVRAVARGKAPPELAPDHVNGHRGNPELSVLSNREREVLRFIAIGHTNAETADALQISVKTVEGYRARVTRKLDAHNRVDLVRHAMRFGLLMSV